MNAATDLIDDSVVADANDTVDEIVRVSVRRDIPIRRTFLQAVDEEGRNGPGPLATFVTSGDQRALTLYLLLLTKASAEPWDATLPSAVWARALGVELPMTKTASSTISKTWLRLERRQLIARRRIARRAKVVLLKEDGSGEPYSKPASASERYFKLPVTLWTTGPTERTRWYRELTLPELAILMIARSQLDDFSLPFERAEEWYGISADTVSRGVHGLEARGLMSIEKRFKKAPLSPIGYTSENVYKLAAPFGPIGKSRKSIARKSRRVTA